MRPDESGSWTETPIDDTDLQDALELAPVRSEFWSGIDLSELAALSGSPVTFNGIRAYEIALTEKNFQLLGSLFGVEKDELQGLGEFTMWFAEEGRWPLGLKASFIAEPGSFLAEEVEEPVGDLPDNIPTKFLNSFHYNLTVVMKEETDLDSGEVKARFEFGFAISKVNDDQISISPPQ